MADQKISQMPSASTLTGAELTPLVQSGVNVQATTTVLVSQTIQTDPEGFRSDLQLADVAHTGSYNDLTDKPTLGTISSQDANNVNITGGTISGTTVAGYVPTSRTITAGVGLSGGGDLSANRTIDIENTGVTAATYGSSTKIPVVTFNAQGQATSASEITLTPSSLGIGFGEIYVAGGATPQTTSGTANTYTQVTAFTTNGASATGVTPVASSDKLTLVNAGIYQITFNATFTASNNHTFLFRCYNSTAASAFANTVTKNHTQSTDPHQVGFSALITVTANQDVIVQVASTDTSQPFTISDANFIAVQLG